ncbi:MAG TPA: hypothetical protein VFI91_04415 [Longimicrobiaceae bacterium]|nr:hypothetical protein [Longimicrobiaceae bacterium]
MSHISTIHRGLGALLLLGSLVGCADEIPTATGGDLFPEGTLPVTIELIVPASAFLTEDTVYTGYTSRRDADFLLVADHFDGVLSAHALVRFTDFPDTVSVTVDGTTHKDTVFTYGAGQVTAVVDSIASTEGPVLLRLWALTQEWDEEFVTWELAEEGVAWEEPGGTRGTLLSETIWVPSDTVSGDSLTWEVDSLDVARLSRESPGLLVTSATPGSRVQISDLELSVPVHPVSKDTALVQEISAGPQTFIVTPQPPERGVAWEVGGLASSRTVFTLDPEQEVPTCSPDSGAVCPTIPLSEVTLNAASLILEGVPVPNGYRPIHALVLTLRRVFEPEIGARAPLGSVVSVDSAAASLFISGSEGLVELPVTQPLRAILASDSAATMALLAEPEGSTFGIGWFKPAPRLRLIYTLPLEPRLP